jgi:probable F420-dependent oxidoreductase
VTTAGWQTPPALPTAGIWSHAVSRLGAAHAKAFVEELEGLGIGALWYPEAVGSRESLAWGALLLSWTQSLVLASGIASIYARDGTAAANGALALADAHPGRFVLGLGVSHAPQVAARGHTYARPLSAMESYLDEMDDAPTLGPPPVQPPARLLAALNPRMLALAGTRCAGAHTYFMPPSHTASAREILGPEKTLAVEVGYVLGDDPPAIAEYVEGHLPRDNYRRALLFAGFDDADLAGRGSKRLTDAVTARGTVGDIVDRVQEHLDAGATHVCLQALSIDRGDPKIESVRELAVAIRELNGRATGLPPHGRELGRIQEVRS